MKMTVHPKEKFVGLFILIAILIGLTMIYVNVRSALNEKYTYRLVIPETFGLNKGDKVKFRGLNIGSVESIKIIRNKETQEENIEIYFAILNKDFIEHIRRDSTVSVQPALGPLPASISVNPGMETELLPNNSDILLEELPKASVEALIKDVSDSLTALKELSLKVEKEGIISILGPDIQEKVKSMMSESDAIVAQMRASSDDVATMVDDLKTGKMTISRLMFGEIPLLQAILGDYSQKRIDELNAEKKGMLEWFFGPTVWGEVEAASQSWQPMTAAVLDLMSEAKVVMQRSQDVIDQAMPVIEILTDNRQNINEMMSTLNEMLDDVKVITAEIANQSDEIPATVRQLRDLFQKSDKLMDSLQRHWLLNAFTEEKPAKTEIPIRTFRPNHYGE